MTRWLTRAAWESASQPDGAGLRKVWIADEIEKASLDSDDASKTRPIYRFTISTSAVDRERDTVSVDGWKLATYRRNPIVLWAHDYRMPPLGVSAELPKAKDGKLVAGVRFDSDISEMAKLVEAMVDRGTLRTSSVGFRPMKHERNDQRMGYDFLEQELLEWSIVPVPANPEALLEARSAGLDLAPLKVWAEEVLSIETGPGFWLSRATLEDVWQKSGNSPIYSFTLAPQTHSDANGGSVTVGGSVSILSTPQVETVEKTPDDAVALDDEPEAQPTQELALREVNGEIVFDDDDDEITDADAKEIFTALAAEAADRAILRLTGRVD